MSNDLINLRKRVADAAMLGVVGEESKPIYEATLIQIMNEAERQRMRCNSLAEEFKRKVAQAEAQANAFSQMYSIIYNVINGFVLSAEKAQEEEDGREEEQAEAVEEEEVEEKPRTRRRKRK
jgi:hypothetical protein